MSDLLFGRFASITVADAKNTTGTLIQGVRITFKILKDVTKVLNSADIEVYGLSAATIALFSGVGARVLLQAGYTGLDGQQKAIGTVFYGDITQQYDTQEGAERVLRIAATDSYSAFRAANHQFSFGVGYSALQGLADVLQAAGIPVDFPGNLQGFVEDKPFLTGWHFSGNAKKAIESLANRLGLEFLMLDGRARFLIRGASTARTSSSMAETAAQARSKIIAPYISPETGLIGSIEKASMLKDTGKASANPQKVAERHGWKFRCLLNPQLQPGSPVFLQGRAIPNGGAFRVDRVLQQGDTHGADWFSECIVPIDQLATVPRPGVAGGPDNPESGVA